MEAWILPYKAHFRDLVRLPGIENGGAAVSQERTEAIVLRGVDFSETSRIVTFLCPARGKLACMARGARRPKSGLAAVLDTYNRLDLVYYWKDGRQVQALGDVALLDSYGTIKADLEKVTFAAFPLELCMKVAHENEPSHELYAALIKGLDGLKTWPENINDYTAWWVLRLLAASGYEVQTEECVACGSTRSAAWGFSYDGGIVCSRCRSDRQLTTAQYNSLKRLNAAPDRCPDVKNGGTLLDVLRGYAARQFETDFRSIRVINQMYP